MVVGAEAVCLGVGERVERVGGETGAITYAAWLARLRRRVQYEEVVNGPFTQTPSTWPAAPTPEAADRAHTAMATPGRNSRFIGSPFDWVPACRPPEPLY